MYFSYNDHDARYWNICTMYSTYYTNLESSFDIVNPWYLFSIIMRLLQKNKRSLVAVRLLSNYRNESWSNCSQMFFLTPISCESYVYISINCNVLYFSIILLLNILSHYKNVLMINKLYFQYFNIYLILQLLK